MLNRDSIRDGVVYKLLKKNQHITKTIPQTPEERSESLKNTLKERPADIMFWGYFVLKSGGEGGIRTLDTFDRIPVF